MSPQWILVIVLIALVYFLFIKKKPLPGENKKSSKSKKSQDDDMVACQKCGVYVSLNEALLQNGEYFCSDECLS